jgi:hypothetical protein
MAWIEVCILLSRGCRTRILDRTRCASEENLVNPTSIPRDDAIAKTVRQLPRPNCRRGKAAQSRSEYALHQPFREVLVKVFEMGNRQNLGE